MYTAKFKLQKFEIGVIFFFFEGSLLFSPRLYLFDQKCSKTVIQFNIMTI